MLHRQSAVTFASSVSSGSASSRCLLGLRRRLSPLLSLLGWTASTACSSTCLLEDSRSVLNAAARLICNRRKYDHVTPLLRDVLHWLHRVQALSTRHSITTRSCSRLFARLLHCNSFIRARATTAITGEGCS